MTSSEEVDHFEIPSSGGEDEELTAQLFRPPYRAPSAPSAPKGITHRWRAMTAPQSRGVWDALAAWVRWLVATYQLTTSVVPDCWWRHAEIVAELYALQKAELASYAADDSGFGPLAFHERLPHAVDRLRTHTRAAGCVGLQTHKEPVLRILATDDPTFLEWRLRSHQLMADF